MKTRKFKCLPRANVKRNRNASFSKTVLSETFFELIKNQILPEFESRKFNVDKQSRHFTLNTFNTSNRKPVKNLHLTASNCNMIVNDEPINLSTNSTSLPRLVSISSFNCTEDSSLSKKSKRGRPPIDCSSPPTSEQLKNVDPKKLKYLQKRYKNNEASRKSRRKQQLKKEKLKLEEKNEIERNENLRKKHAKLLEKHEFLKEYLFPFAKPF